MYLYIITRAYVFPFFSFQEKIEMIIRRGDRIGEKKNFVFFLAESLFSYKCNNFALWKLHYTNVHSPNYPLRTKKTALCLSQNFKQSNSLIFFHKTYIECTFETLFQFTVTQKFVKSVKMAKLSYDNVIKYVA